MLRNYNFFAVYDIVVIFFLKKESYLKIHIKIFTNGIM